MSCDCPICPLVANNTQVCDVIVTLFPKRNKVFVTGISSDVLSDAFAKLVLGQVSACKKGNYKMDVGRSYSWEKPEYEYTLYVIKKDQYKVCFHTKAIEDEDPM